MIRQVGYCEIVVANTVAGDFHSPNDPIRCLGFNRRVTLLRRGSDPKKKREKGKRGGRKENEVLIKSFSIHFILCICVAVFITFDHIKLITLTTVNSAFMNEYKPNYFQRWKTTHA